jgi:sortase A
VRRRNFTNGYERDPLLKVGMGAMIVALGFAIVVAVAASLDTPMQVASAKPEEVKSTTASLVRSDPGIVPWVERDIPPPKPEVVPEREASPKPAPAPKAAVPKPDNQPTPPELRPEQQTRTPQREDAYPLPTDGQVHAANQPRRYRLPPDAIMSLSVPSIGLKNAPVLNSDARSALDQGVIHLPDTSLPWSETPERNVYLAGHRLGWPGTGSHLIFYRLNELDRGERITLRGREGKRYDYRVIENFIVGPGEGWVAGRVRGRDLLTLQTCTPIPTFQKRLIVRAERS